MILRTDEVCPICGNYTSEGEDICPNCKRFLNNDYVKNLNNTKNSFYNIDLKKLWKE